MRKEDVKPVWHVIDASDMILGRMSTRIADLLRGKGKPDFTPHTDNGDYVVITNCDKIKLTGAKWQDKMYESYSGWRGGLRKRSAQEVYDKDSTQLVRFAVKRMLPKTRLGRQMFRRLKAYQGAEHPHSAQV